MNKILYNMLRIVEKKWSQKNPPVSDRIDGAIVPVRNMPYSFGVK